MTEPLHSVLCPAKLNLFLEVLHRREDGFHEVRLFNTAIDLKDRVDIRKHKQDQRIDIHCDHPAVPKDSANLCVKAARAFFEEFPDAATGLEISITKNIPVAGGLGGGSSNAAGALLLLNRMSGHPATPERLRELGSRVGSDVPFFLFSSPAWASGRGEDLHAAPPLSETAFLVVSFDFGVPAAEAYAAWDLTNKLKKDTLGYPPNRENPTPRKEYENDLQPGVQKRYPAVEKALKSFKGPGLIACLMSGSGPTVFGVYDSIKSARKGTEVFKGWEAVTARVAAPITGIVLQTLK